jgi:urea transport system permease protein
MPLAEMRKTPLGLEPVATPDRSELRRPFLVGLSLLALFVPLVYFEDNEFRLSLFTQYLALAIVALGVDLIWGYTGMLSLGQGVYFGLGAYSVAYSLKLQKAAASANAPPGMVVPPDFMNWTNLPLNHPDYVAPRALLWIAPLMNIWVALAAAVLVPTLVATLFGWVTFRLRIRGVYFSLITQALVLAIFTLVLNQQPITGGVVGITYLAKLELFGHTFKRYWDLYFLTAGVLVTCFLACAWLVRTKFGKVLTAIRDNENRVLALGYNTAMYKTFAFALAGGLSGLAGALFVGANGSTGPEYLSIAWSIEAVIWVAVGGRGTLLGAILGTLLVKMVNTHINEAIPKYWPLILGFLFIGVTVFLARGIMSIAGRGALLGAILGTCLAEYTKENLEELLPEGMSDFWHRVAVAGHYLAVMIAMLFVPRLLGWLGGLIWRWLGHLRTTEQRASA